MIVRYCSSFGNDSVRAHPYLKKYEVLAMPFNFMFTAIRFPDLC